MKSYRQRHIPFRRRLSGNSHIKFLKILLCVFNQFFTYNNLYDITQTSKHMKTTFSCKVMLTTRYTNMNYLLSIPYTLIKSITHLLSIHPPGDGHEKSESCRNMTTLKSLLLVVRRVRKIAKSDN
jgi:hypothetical protein